MTVWSTPQGRVIWRIEGTQDFAELDPIKRSVYVIHQAGTVSDEDDLHEWSYSVVDDELRKRLLTTRYSEPSVVKVSTARAQLDLLEGKEAAHWERASREIYAAYVGGVNAEARLEKENKTTRETSLLGALPKKCGPLVFIAIAGGWGVATEGTRDTIWTETNYRWRGKDLHYELQLVLRRLRPDVESFGTDLRNQAEMMCYYGE